MDRSHPVRVRRPSPLAVADRNERDVAELVEQRRNTHTVETAVERRDNGGGAPAGERQPEAFEVRVDDVELVRHRPGLGQRHVDVRGWVVPVSEGPQAARDCRDEPAVDARIGRRKERHVVPSTMEAIGQGGHDPLRPGVLRGGTGTIGGESRAIRNGPLGAVARGLEESVDIGRISVDWRSSPQRARRRCSHPSGHSLSCAAGERLAITYHLAFPMERKPCTRRRGFAGGPSACECNLPTGRRRTVRKVPRLMLGPTAIGPEPREEGLGDDARRCRRIRRVAAAGPRSRWSSWLAPCSGSRPLHTSCELPARPAAATVRPWARSPALGRLLRLAIVLGRTMAGKRRFTANASVTTGLR